MLHEKLIGIHGKKKKKKQPKVLDPVTLFHDPKLSSSVRTLNFLKQASVIAAEEGIKGPNHRGEFDLQVTTEPPTGGQLENILEYISKSDVYKPSQVVLGANDAADALKKFQEDSGRFVRPVVRPSLSSRFGLVLVWVVADLFCMQTVDWTGGKAVLGDNESEILKLVRNAWPEN